MVCRGTDALQLHDRNPNIGLGLGLVLGLDLGLVLGLGLGLGLAFAITWRPSYNKYCDHKVQEIRFVLLHIAAYHCFIMQCKCIYCLLYPQTLRLQLC